MKFTRSLALAAAAAFAMTMTACDDDSTSSNEPTRNLAVDTLWAGTQGSQFGSFISLTQDTVYNSTTVKGGGVNGNWANLDMIFFADNPASISSSGTLYAPDEAKAKFASLNTMPNPRATRFFAPATDDDIRLSEIVTDANLAGILSKFDMATEMKSYEVTAGDIFLVRLADGTKAIVKAEIINDKGMTNGSRNIELFIRAKL